MKYLTINIFLLTLFVFTGIAFAQEYKLSSYSFSGNASVQSTSSETKINATIGSAVVGVSQSSNFIISGNYYNSYFLIANSVTSTNESENLPTKFNLDQNYPNPFNPTTVIKYSIPNEGNVVLTIYNLLGQKVCVLVNENKSPGSYQVTWDASRYSSGVYVYYLTNNNQSLSKKLLLLK